MAGLEGMESLQLGSRTFQNRIEEEMKDINTLLLSAKTGKWNDVWRIFGIPEKPKKAYLINSIPENRRWGVLHQAVYWKDPNILQNLLKFRACDSRIKAKECTSEVGKTSGMTALAISRAYGCKEVEKVLLQHECNFKEEDEEIDTFQPWHADIEPNGFGLIPVTLANYKNTFHPQKIDPQKSILSVLGDIFKDLNTSENRWKEVREKMCDSLYVVSEESVAQLKKCTSRQNFYEAIINVYTEESTYLYTYVNTALRRQQESDYKPSAADLAMGPYVVMYQTLLIFWGQLKRENAKTYRKMLLTPKDMEKYQVGVKFTWLSFVSSSVEAKKAMPFPTCGGVKGECSVTFIIDNTAGSMYQPRDIEKYAKYTERERVYPAGAKFEVTNRRRDNEKTYVTLKLLSS
ncbi:hypothetical protein CHS0354_002102 [Potamilus streckersoni]|uniref:Uncharacterized protein n=1 Tax=Potamilus streckersoni TaxID=2493646 RepID=A0AAE0SV35_9BIVA|nr:hypothetical protein CHS0354_002102 [Potamilus streckersoni]